LSRLEEFKSSRDENKSSPVGTAEDFFSNLLAQSSFQALMARLKSCPCHETVGLSSVIPGLRISGLCQEHWQHLVAVSKHRLHLLLYAYLVG
jgi:hypothetical protein